jgi:hypothetical protein
MPIDDAPRVGGNKNFVDELTITAIHRYPDVSGDEQLYRTLMEALATMTGGGPDADENYQRTIRELRDDDTFIDVVLKTLDALEEDEYQERWALIQLAIDLEQPAAGDYLVEFVRRDIPPERSKDPVHGVSTVTEEVILRTTAIEGLARLFRHDYDSSDALLEIVSSAEYVALRRASWFALIDNGRDDAVERARETLRDGDYGWIADLKRIPVHEAEQHNPERINPPKRGDIPPPFNE